MLKLNNNRAKKMFSGFYPYDGKHTIRENNGLVDAENNREKNLIKAGYKIVRISYRENRRWKTFRLGKSEISVGFNDGFISSNKVFIPTKKDIKDVFDQYVKK